MRLCLPPFFLSFLILLLPYGVSLRLFLFLLLLSPRRSEGTRVAACKRDILMASRRGQICCAGLVPPLSMHLLPAWRPPACSVAGRLAVAARKRREEERADDARAIDCDERHIFFFFFSSRAYAVACAHGSLHWIYLFLRRVHVYPRCFPVHFRIDTPRF